MIISVIDGDPSVESVLVRLREGDELIVERLEDLGSELADVVRTLENIQRRRVRLKVVRDDLDSDAVGIAHLLRGLRVAADFQRRARRKGWRTEIEAAREAGAFKSGRPRLQLDNVAELRAQGLGATEIARRLNVSRWSVYRRLKQLEASA
jgi:DNA invertase Pin-like site-specific DNA recombinase